jgi:hypothetical protein
VEVDHRATQKVDREGAVQSERARFVGNARIRQAAAKDVGLEIDLGRAAIPVRSRVIFWNRTNTLNHGIVVCKHNCHPEGA